MLHHLVDAAHRRGVAVHIEETALAPERERDLVSRARAHLVDGVVPGAVCEPRSAEEAAEALAQYLVSIQPSGAPSGVTTPVFPAAYNQNTGVNGQLSHTFFMNCGKTTDGGMTFTAIPSSGTTRCAPPRSSPTAT